MVKAKPLTFICYYSKILFAPIDGSLFAMHLPQGGVVSCHKKKQIKENFERDMQETTIQVP